MCACVHATAHMWIKWKICNSLFPPSPKWISEINLGSTSLVVAPFLVEPFHWLYLQFYFTLNCILVRG